MTCNLNKPEPHPFSKLEQGLQPVFADKVFRAIIYYATSTQAILPCDAKFLLSELISATVKLYTGNDAFQFRHHGQTPPRYEHLVWRDYEKHILNAKTPLLKSVKNAITYLVYPHDSAVFGVHDTNLDLYYRASKPITGSLTDNIDWKKETKYFQKINYQWMDKVIHLDNSLIKSIEDYILPSFTKAQNKEVSNIGHVMSLYLAEDLKYLCDD